MQSCTARRLTSNGADRSLEFKRFENSASTSSRNGTVDHCCSHSSASAEAMLRAVRELFFETVSFVYPKNIYLFTWLLKAIGLTGW